MSTTEEQIAAEIAKIKADWEAANDRAWNDRAQALKNLAERHGLKQVDLVGLTGWSRETLRQALDPELRKAIQVKRRKGGAE